MSQREDSPPPSPPPSANPVVREQVKDLLTKTLALVSDPNFEADNLPINPKLPWTAQVEQMKTGFKELFAHDPIKMHVFNGAVRKLMATYNSEEFIANPTDENFKELIMKQC